MASEVTREMLGVSLECRDMRHAWTGVGDTVLIQQDGQVRHFQRRLSCIRCSTERLDEYKISAFSLARVRSRYLYPEGYRVPGGLSVEKARWFLFSKQEMVAAEQEETG